MRQPREISAGRGVVAAVVDDDDLVIAIGRARQRIDAAREHVAVVPARYQHRDARPVVGKLVAEDADARACRPLRLHRAAAAAAPQERIVDGKQAGGEALGLRGARGRGRSGSGAPVIEDERHVDDPARALARAKREVVVLRALEAGAESAERREQRAPHDERVRKVHVGEQQLRRPVRLELRRVTTPSAPILSSSV